MALQYSKIDKQVFFFDKGLTSRLYWSPCNMAFLFYFILLFAFTEYCASLPINFQILVVTTLDSVEKAEFYGHQHLAHIGISASVFETD